MMSMLVYVRCTFCPVQSTSLHKRLGREPFSMWKDFLTLVGESSIVSVPGAPGNDRGKVYGFRAGDRPNRYDAKGPE